MFLTFYFVVITDYRNFQKKTKNKKRIVRSHTPFSQSLPNVNYLHNYSTTSKPGN